MPVARQQQHLRRHRPRRRRPAHQRGNGLGSAQAAGQQVAGVFENGHADAQVLARAIVRQFLHRVGQGARRHHEVIDAIGLRQEPGVRRGRLRRQQRHRVRFDHRKPFVRRRRRPGLVRQLSVRVGDPGRRALRVQRQHKRLRERGGGEGRGPAGAHLRRAGAGREIAPVLRRGAVHDEIAVVARVRHGAAHGQHVGAVGRHPGRNRQHGRRRVLIVERQAAEPAAVQAEFGAVVGIARGGFRPALHVHLQRPRAAVVAGQIQRERHLVRRRIGGADHEIPIIEIGGPHQRAVERKHVLFAAHLRGHGRRALRRARLAPGHGAARARGHQIDVVPRVPVRGRLPVERQPRARDVVERRHRRALEGHPQTVRRRQVLRVFDGDAQTAREGGQIDAVDAFVAQPNLQHGRRAGGARRAFRARRRARRAGRRRRKHDRMRPQIVRCAVQGRLFQAITAGTAGNRRGIDHRIRRGRIVERHRHQRFGQAGFGARGRIDAVHVESRRSPRPARPPYDAPCAVRPPSLHRLHVGPGHRCRQRRFRSVAPIRAGIPPRETSARARQNSDHANQTLHRNSVGDGWVHLRPTFNGEML